MKGLRFILLGLAICLARGVKAQFYDGPEDIYYYVLIKMENSANKTFDYDENKATVYIFNFDGIKAAQFTTAWGGDPISWVRDAIGKNPNYYEEKVETTLYNWKYDSTSSAGITYISPNDRSSIFTFSRDRNTLIRKEITGSLIRWWTFKRVDKNYFKVGRSRTPSGTLHE